MPIGAPFAPSGHLGALRDARGAGGRVRGDAAVEPQEAAEASWVEHASALAAGTLYPTCNPWYLGTSLPDEPRIYLGPIGCAYVS